MRRWLPVALCIVMASVAAGSTGLAGETKSGRRTNEQSVDKERVVLDRKHGSNQTVPLTKGSRTGRPSQTTAFTISDSSISLWWTVSVGYTEASSDLYDVEGSGGETTVDTGSSEMFDMKGGYWVGVEPGVCAIEMTGDVNVNGSITSADIIYLVGYVFKGGLGPEPCEGAGDVNCSGSVTSADIIYLVGYVFKGGAPPCDVCTLIPGTWSCP